MNLNFGCGSIQPEGWVNVDMEDFGQEHVGGTELFDNDTFETIVAHCTLQITEWHELVDHLKELHRILKPGGVLRVSLPDIERGFKALQEDDIDWFPNGEDNINDRFSAWLTWYSTSRTLLTPRALANKFGEAGFTVVGKGDYKVSALADELITELDTRENECYFMEAGK
jgi:predicted SAM-dependent methyltransferase